MINLGTSKNESDDIDTHPDLDNEKNTLSKDEIYEPIPYIYWPQKNEKSSSYVATVEVPLEALVKELGEERTIEFISEIRARYGNSITEQKRATESLTIKEIEFEVRDLKK